MEKSFSKKPALQPRDVETCLLGSADVSLPESQLEEDAVPLLSDEVALERAKTQWLLGEWTALSELNIKALRHHPERAHFALLAASAFDQLGDHDNAGKLTRLALEWGCPPQVVAHVLLAGVHNTLGRVAALREDEAGISRHFEAAVALDGNTDTALVSHARTVREMAGMGLLPQAVTLAENLLHDSNQPGVSPDHKTAHAKVLEIELEWLRERTLYLQKQLDISGKKTVVGKLAENKNLTPDLSSPPGATLEKYYGLHGLDRKLETYLAYDGGYFVELGANDGIAQSNTLYFEKKRNWRGLLIEPILHNYLKCKKNRSAENKFCCAACVSFDYDKPYVTLTYSNLMTSPSGLESDIEDAASHAESGKIYLGEDEDTVEVLAQAKTLNAILDDVQAPPLMDLLSLDVEGAEIEVLKGVDHEKYRFKYILIESRDREKIEMYLKGKGYFFLDKLSHQDYLFVDHIKFKSSCC